MTSMQETTNDIQEMHSTVRIAGYLMRLSAFAESAAKLRISKEDEEWTAEEESEFEKFCDELDPWFYGMTDDERQFLRKSGIENVFGKIARGEKLV